MRPIHFKVEPIYEVNFHLLIRAHITSPQWYIAFTFSVRVRLFHFDIIPKKHKNITYQKIYIHLHQAKRTMGINSTEKRKISKLANLHDYVQKVSYVPTWKESTPLLWTKRTRQRFRLDKYQVSWTDLKNATQTRQWGTESNIMHAVENSTALIRTNK